MEYEITKGTPIAYKRPHDSKWSHATMTTKPHTFSWYARREGAALVFLYKGYEVRVPERLAYGFTFYPAPKKGKK